MSKIFLKLFFFWQKPKIVVVTSGNLEPTRNFISQVLGKPFLLERKVLISNYQEQLPLRKKGYLVLNFDNEDIRKIKEKSSAKILTFGFQEGADFQASDVKINGGINFKINYKGNVVPVWLEKFSDKEQVYAALAAAAVGEALGLNLVEVSEALRGLPRTTADCGIGA